MQIIKIVIFILACIGLYLHVKRKYEIKEEFIPIILVSIIGLIEFFAGILNCMVISTILIMLVGIYFFIKEIYLIIKNKEKVKIKFNLILFVFILIWFAYLLKGTVLTHNDNFSHWAVMIREMLETNKLPNSQTKVLTHITYPPGTACFLYFVCKFIGNSEECYVFAQSILILSGIYAIFAFGNKDKKVNYVIAIITLLYLLIGNVFIDQLLVDTVLPVMGIAGLAIIVYYKNDNKKGLIYSIPVLSLLILVKNSGIFFVIIDLIVWLYIYIQNHSVKSIFKTKYIAVVLVLILLLIIWKIHLGITFENANKSIHAMSIENYISNIKRSDIKYIVLIFQNMINKMTDINNSENIIMSLLFSTYIIMIGVSYKNKRLQKRILKSLVLFISIYIVYQICLYGMYIFSMSILEAKMLACYDRYYKTIVLFEYGLTIIVLFKFMDNIKITNKIKSLLLKCIFLTIITIPIIFYPNLLKKTFIKNSEHTEYEVVIRTKLLNYIEKYNIEENKKYMIYADESVNKIFLWHICRYEFKSSHLEIVRNVDVIEKRISSYDYLIILSENDEVNELIEEMYGDKKQEVIKIN